MKDILESFAEQCRYEFLKNQTENCHKLQIKESTAEKYQIGIVPKQETLSASLNSGHSYEEFNSMSLSSYSNRYCFPSRRADGRISGFFFKKSDVSQDGPIWIHRAFETDDWYGIDQCHLDKKYILLCEGVSDVLASADFGLFNTVACGFGQFPSNEQMALLRQFKTVILAFDNDSFGRGKTEKVKQILSKNGIVAATLEYVGLDVYDAMKDSTHRNQFLNELKTIMNG